MKLEAATDIAAPPAAVFAVMMDISRWPQIIRGIERIEVLTAGPIGAGARFRETRTMFGRTATEEMTVAEVVSPQRLVFTAENHGTRYRVVHSVQAAPDGARLTVAFEGTPVTITARLLSAIGVLFAGALRRQLESDLADIKAEAERRAAA